MTATIVIAAVLVIVVIVIAAAVSGPKDGDHKPQTVIAHQKAQGGTRACPYCNEPISTGATRCKHCAGEMRACPACGDIVGLTTKQKFVGLARGGMKVQSRCMRCNRVLDGPRI